MITVPARAPEKKNWLRLVCSGTQGEDDPSAFKLGQKTRLAEGVKTSLVAVATGFTPVWPCETASRLWGLPLWGFLKLIHTVRESATEGLSRGFLPEISRAPPPSWTFRAGSQKQQGVRNR